MVVLRFLRSFNENIFFSDFVEDTKIFPTIGDGLKSDKGPERYEAQKFRKCYARTEKAVLTHGLHLGLKTKLDWAIILVQAYL